MKIAIVGGYGNMGQWFARFLSKEGKKVVISGRDQAKLRETAGRLGVESASNEQAVAASDAVILSVPINSFESIVKEIAPHTHADQYIFDITSIKAKPVEIMHKYIKKGTILGVHPMFGPVMEPVEHDDLMSIVLGLSHFIALVSADTLLHLDKLEKAREISGTTYRTLLTMAEGVVSEDSEFYSSLQMNLPGLAGIEKLFHLKAGEWSGLVSKGDRKEFAKRMRELKIGFEKEDPAFADAYKNMYRLIGE